MIYAGTRSDLPGTVVINARADGATMRVGVDEWLAFLNAVKRGDFDRVHEGQPVVDADELYRAAYRIGHQHGYNKGRLERAATPAAAGRVDLGDDPDGDLEAYDGGYTDVTTEDRIGPEDMPGVGA